MSNREIAFQLITQNGGLIQIAGGELMVCVAGTPHKATLFDKDGVSTANPASFVNGRIQVQVPKTSDTVDLYIRSPTGHFRVVKGHKPGTTQSIHIDIQVLRATYVVPFSIVDCTANVEKDSGFDLATDALVQPLGCGIEVAVLESGKTISFGTLSSESGGVAAGFGSALSTTLAGWVGAQPTVTTGVLASNTLGAQLNDYVVGTNADDRGIAQGKVFRCNGTSKSISYTLAAASVAAEGFIVFNVDLGNWTAQATQLA